MRIKVLSFERTQSLEMRSTKENKEAIHEMDVCPLSSSLEPVVFFSRTGGELVVAIQLPRGNWTAFECSLISDESTRV